MKLCPAIRHHRRSEVEPFGDPGTRGMLLDYIRNPECKRLLHRISTAQRERNFKSLAVLSQNPGQGKALFISVVALGFMELMNKAVLIMDTVSQTRDESFYYHGLRGGRAQDLHAFGTPRQPCIDILTSQN